MTCQKLNLIKTELDEMRGKIAGLEKEAEQMVKTARKDAQIEKERILAGCDIRELPHQEDESREAYPLPEQAGLL